MWMINTKTQCLQPHLQVKRKHDMVMHTIEDLLTGLNPTLTSYICGRLQKHNTEDYSRRLKPQACKLKKVSYLT